MNIIVQKKEIMNILTEYNFVDMSTDNNDTDDYPDFAFRVAEAVANKEVDLGVLLCGTGIGMSIASNRAKGVRAALCMEPIFAEMSRKHNDANVCILPCDYICYVDGELYLIELKSHLGNTFPLGNLRQLQKMQQFNGIKGVHIGVVIWYRDNDKVIYCPISTIKRLIEDDKKSINIKYLTTEEYTIYEVPSIKKRTFMESDYSDISNMQGEQ